MSLYKFYKHRVKELNRTDCEANNQDFKLHAHLSGSVSRACLHEIWLQRKATEPGLSLEDPLVAIPEGKVDFDIKTCVCDVASLSVYSVIV